MCCVQWACHTARQIYNEEVRDLLAVGTEKKDRLELKEDPNKGVYVKVFYTCSERRQRMLRTQIDNTLLNMYGYVLFHPHIYFHSTPSTP